jgi:hypothetical protein
MYRTLLLILAFSIASISYSQLANFKGGIEAGITGTQVDGDDLGGYNKAGFRAGAFIEKEFNKKWSSLFSMVYFPKGSRDSISFAIKLHYIEMPLSIRYHHPKGIMGEAGLGLGYLFAQKAIRLNEFSQVETGDEAFSNFDFTMHLGVGYKLFPYTYLHAQWSYSLIPILGGYNQTPKLQTNTLMEVMGLYGMYNNTLMIALQIYLGKRERS